MKEISNGYYVDEKGNVYSNKSGKIKQFIQTAVAVFTLEL